MVWEGLLLEVSRVFVSFDSIFSKDALLESKPAALLLEALLAPSAINEAAGCEVLTRLIFSVGINFPPILLSRAMQVLCQFFGHLIV